MAPQVTNVIKSKSSNSCMNKSDKSSHKKSRSNGEFQPEANRKLRRSLYVNSKDSSDINGIVVNELPSPTNKNNEKWLQSVLNFISKCTASTQCPDSKEKRHATQYATTFRSKFQNKISIPQENLVTVKLKTQKSENSIINDTCSAEVSNNTKKILKAPVSYSTVADTFYKQTYTNIISINSEDRKAKLKNSQNFIQNVASDPISTFTKVISMNRNEKQLTNNQMFSALAQEIEKGKAPQKPKRRDTDEPRTLVDEHKRKDESRLYSFFVDLLETTVSVYNVKTDYDITDCDMVTPSENSRVRFEIDESVAKILEIKDEQEYESLPNTQISSIADITETETPDTNIFPGIIPKKEDAGFGCLTKTPISNFRSRSPWSYSLHSRTTGSPNHGSTKSKSPISASREYWSAQTRVSSPPISRRSKSPMSRSPMSRTSRQCKSPKSGITSPNTTITRRTMPPQSVNKQPRPLSESTYSTSSNVKSASHRFRKYAIPKCKTRSSTYVEQYRANLPEPQFVFKGNQPLNRKAKKLTFLNMLKQQLAKDVYVYEKPQTLYDSLKIMARNKKKCLNSMQRNKCPKNVDNDFGGPDCMRRKNLISSVPRSKDWTKKDLIQSFRSNSVKVSKYSKPNKPKVDFNYNYSDTESIQSIEVFGYDYSPVASKRRKDIREKNILFAASITSVQKRHDMDSDFDVGKSLSAMLEEFSRNK